ncbi:MAG TPA: hypothetical protein VF354_05745 [Candidatus Methanoperedens sp.]
MNRWKAFALIMIALLAIAVGIRFFYLGAHIFTIDDKQKIYAINAAQEGLKDEMGGNNYNITVEKHGSMISTANGDKKVVRVFFTQENTTLTALVDMDTGNIVEKSKMETSGWMIDYKNQKSRRWGHQESIDR